MQEKYNTKAAALYRDMIATVARGEAWDEASSPAQAWVVPRYEMSERVCVGGSSQGERDRQTDRDRDRQTEAGTERDGKKHALINTRTARHLVQHL